MFIPYAKSSEFSKANAQEVIRDARWKLTKETLFKDDGLLTDTVSYKLFNLLEDPDETTDVFEQEQDIAKSLKERLEKWSEMYYKPL